MKASGRSLAVPSGSWMAICAAMIQLEDAASAAVFHARNSQPIRESLCDEIDAAVDALIALRRVINSQSRIVED